MLFCAPIICCCLVMGQLCAKIMGKPKWVCGALALFLWFLFAVGIVVDAFAAAVVDKWAHQYDYTDGIIISEISVITAPLSVLLFWLLTPHSSDACAIALKRDAPDLSERATRSKPACDVQPAVRSAAPSSVASASPGRCSRQSTRTPLTSTASACPSKTKRKGITSPRRAAGAGRRDPVSGPDLRARALLRLRAVRKFGERRVEQLRHEGLTPFGRALLAHDCLPCWFSHVVCGGVGGVSRLEQTTAATTAGRMRDMGRARIVR